MTRKIFLLLSLLLTVGITSFAQSSYRIKGRALETENKEAVEKAVVTLYKTDSTYIGSMLTDSLGRFALPADMGRYMVKISAIGYDEAWRNVTVESGNINLGDILLKENAIMLQETMVTPTCPKWSCERIP